VLTKAIVAIQLVRMPVLPPALIDQINGRINPANRITIEQILPDLVLTGIIARGSLSIQ
jgi:hypothetical protein